MKKKTHALSMLKEGVSIAHVATDLYHANQKSGNRDEEEDH